VRPIRDGLRAWKQTDAGARTYYLYDGSDPVAELDASGNVQALNTFGVNGLVSRHTTATNASVFYTFDERGNVAQRLDSNGVALSTDLYDAFGARTGTTPPSDPWGFGAQWGYQSDAETGLVLCTNRYYDPQQGRFVTRDPIGYAGGVNLYGYVGNNPVNSVDPLGLTFSPDPASKDKFWEAINYLKQFPLANKVITALDKSTTTYFIQTKTAEQNDAGASFNPRNNTVYWDPTASFFLDTKGSLSPALMLGHELDHAYHTDQNRALADSLYNQHTGTDYDNEEEARTIIYFENKVASHFKNGIRHDHRFKYHSFGIDPRNFSHVANVKTCAP